MARDIILANQGAIISDGAPVAETFRVGSVQNYTSSLKKLARANPDWNLSSAEIISAGKAGRKIYKIKFTNSPVKFAPVPESPGQTYLTIAGEIVGILSSEDTARIKTIFSSFDTQRVSCTLRGGLYKIVDSHGNVETQQQGFAISLKITYAPKGIQAAPVQNQAISTPRSSSSRHPDRPRASSRTSATRAAKAKKPFYKRWWFWTIVGLLALSMFGSGSEEVPPATSPASISETVPSEAAIPETTSSEIPMLETTSPAAEALTTGPVSIESTQATASPPPETTMLPATETQRQETTYILNTNSHKFHYTWCSSADDIKEKNKDSYTGTREEVIARGYDPCKKCNP